MNAKRAEFLLPIITAFAAGAVVQSRKRTVECWGGSRGNEITFSEWECDDDPVWSWGCEYRVRPEPVIMYANIYYPAGIYVYNSIEEAIRQASMISGSFLRTVKLVEEIEGYSPTYYD